MGLIPRSSAPIGIADLCAQISLQVLAGEGPVMVRPEGHVAYTQC